MKCLKCGYNNDELDAYCIKCGAPLTNRVQPKKKSKLPIILLILALLIGGGIGGYFYLNKDKDTKDYSTLIEEADEYLKNEDYKQAIAVYLEAIEVEPKEVKPYLQLADIYVIQEDYTSAFDILDQAKENIGEDNEEINSKYEEIQQEYKSYTNKGMYSAYLDTLEDLESEHGSGSVIDKNYLTFYNGVFLAKVIDLDQDGNEEMVVLYNENTQMPDDTTCVIVAYDTDSQSVVTHEYTYPDTRFFFGTDGGYATFYIDYKDGIYYLDGGGEDDYEDHYYFTLDKNKELVLKQKVEIEYSTQDSDAYQIDDKSTTYEACRDVIDSYTCTYAWMFSGSDIEGLETVSETKEYLQQ